MRRRIQQRAQFLLVLFALGGVLAPVAHRVHHAPARGGEEPQQTAQADDGLAYTVGTHPSQDVTCPLCAHLVVALPEANPLAVTGTVQDLRVSPLPAPASPVLLSGQSRAPPAQA